MATSKCVTGKFLNRRTFGIAGLALLLGSGPSWAGGPPNPTPSDSSFNTAGGSDALYNNDGVDNTAFGFGALFKNTTGSENTASGTNALLENTTGYWNTASGVAALQSNTTGRANTASGFAALYYNSGEYNSAVGYGALFENTTGDWNTASGFYALYANNTGSNNTAFGTSALMGNTTGSYNTAIGYEAGTDSGAYTNTTALGNGAAVFVSNSIVLGNTSIIGIYAKVPTLTALSDRRRKKDIRALDTDLGLDFIEKLQPVSYRFNDGDETERYGFIAQDLEQALPASLHDTIERSEPEHGLALIERQNDKDRTYRVSYGELTAPMVKAIQQQQQEIEALRQKNADLRHALEAMEHRVSALVQNLALRHSIRNQREQVTAAR
jgi:trimeric autotransporter adhesin